MEWSRSQRRHTRWSGRREATTAQKRGPWPKTRRCASSWITTVSSASGGARISRHENARRPWREALPHRVRWSRTLIASGDTSSAAACRTIARSISVAGAGFEPGLQDRARSVVGRPRRKPDDDLVLGRSADPLDARASDARLRRRRRSRWRSPRNRSSAPSRRPPRAARIGSIAGMAVEVPAKPRFALDEERTDVPVRVCPATPTGRWHGHDHAAIGMDHDAQAARAWRSPQGVVEGAAGQVQRGGGLGDGHVPMVPRPNRSGATQQPPGPITGLDPVEDRRHAR